MDVLILGGNSPRHESWIRELAQHIKPAKGEVILHDYRHWQTQEPNANVEYEISRIAEKTAGKTEYIVVAKSIGTVIATLMSGRGLLKPKACLFLGVPLGLASSLPEFMASLIKLPSTTVIQNSADPLGSFKEVEVCFDQYRQITVISDEADTHDYNNFDLIQSCLQKLV